ncbi:LuxR C-terminal-related transcriptional regulator [Streptomyces sp. NPDC002742]|jgi:DNA-binding NarL/FixJ family response regulator|uniref:helix-turn-helix transcriptional regulator n=1 Tax=Streptomyces sp. NPDC002742 TaxID=3364663 RepID=UPI00369433DC
MLEVAVCSDSELFRAGIQQYVDSHPGGAELVDFGGDLARLVQTLNTSAVVVVDGRSHVMALSEFARAMDGSTAMAPRMVVVGTPITINVAIAVLEGPARGILPADCRPSDFHAALRAAASGDYYLSASVFSPLLAKLGEAAYVARNDTALTSREAEILGKLAEGRSSADIASSLRLSKRTVGFHVSNILSKLGAGSRAQAVAYAYQSGLLTPPSRPYGGP